MTASWILTKICTTLKNVKLWRKSCTSRDSNLRLSVKFSEYQCLDVAQLPFSRRENMSAIVFPPRYYVEHRRYFKRQLMCNFLKLNFLVIFYIQKKITLDYNELRLSPAISWSLMLSMCCICNVLLKINYYCQFFYIVIVFRRLKVNLRKSYPQSL